MLFVWNISQDRLVQYIKDSTSHKLQIEYKELNKQYWGRRLWAQGYFAVSSGNVTGDIILQYLQFQDTEEPKRHDNFDMNDL